MLCRTCQGDLEYSFSRERSIKYTAEDGPVVKTITVNVGHCLKDDHYSTIFSEDIIKHKHYSLSEIRSVLENKGDFSLACQRTRDNWKSWFKGVWNTVVKNIQQFIGKFLSQNDISIALSTFLKGCGDEWLRYVLDIFSTRFNNLCIFFDLTWSTITKGSEKLLKHHVDEGADAPWRDTKPP